MQCSIGDCQYEATALVLNHCGFIFAVCPGDWRKITSTLGLAVAHERMMACGGVMGCVEGRPHTFMPEACTMMSLS